MYCGRQRRQTAFYVFRRNNAVTHVRCFTDHSACQVRFRRYRFRGATLETSGMLISLRDRVETDAAEIRKAQEEEEDS